MLADERAWSSPSGATLPFKRSDRLSSFTVVWGAAKSAGQKRVQREGLRRFGCNALVGFVALYWI
ncbi:MAG: hypothetical protein VX470_10065, partial [Planctomycetota bacterium]|nr:hypothetical protein [Planctomycetota bacterium]